MSYRFRLEGQLLVLQVGEYKSEYGYSSREWKWRDATISDIPVRDPFARDPLSVYQVDSDGYQIEAIR